MALTPGVARDLAIGTAAAALGAAAAFVCATRRSYGAAGLGCDDPAAKALSELGALTNEPPGVGVELVMAKSKHGGCTYLDWNATSPIFPEVTRAMTPFMAACFGNPSSSHAFGKPCAEALATARKNVSELVACEPSELMFTSCGTESDNHAIEIGVAKGRPLPSATGRPHIVTSAIEHPAILIRLEAMKRAGRIDFTKVHVNGEGLVSAQAVQEALRPETRLVTIMLSNNEVRKYNPEVVLHTDAAQSLGKVDIDVKSLGVDLLTIVGHKFGAPKGVAALCVSKRLQPIEPFLHGGGQECGRRGGTENVMLIAGLGAAAAVVQSEATRIHAHMRATRDRLHQRLVTNLPGVDLVVNGPKDDSLRLPNTLSIGLTGIQAKRLLEELKADVAASASAACHTHGPTISAVLLAMNVPEKVAIGTLRLSTGRHTTEAEIDKAADLIAAAAKRQLAEQAGP